MERRLREAEPATQQAIQQVVKNATKKYGLASEEWFLAVHEGAEEVLGAYDLKEVNGFGIRLTKMQAAPDGVHEFVTLYF